jgi:hypothetical protein
MPPAAMADDDATTGRGNGGGIFNNGGSLSITSTAITGNGAGPYGNGGGIYNNHGTVTVLNSTLSGNGSNEGGGIENLGTLTLDNSTVRGNTVGAWFDDPGFVGGILNDGQAVLTNCTVSGNSAHFAGGIATGGTLQTRNTIIAGNTDSPGPDDLYGDLGSLGYNLIGNTQGGSGFDPTDLLNVDPLLGPLQDNGGPTQTMALSAGSAALKDTYCKNSALRLRGPWDGVSFH